MKRKGMELLLVENRRLVILRLLSEAAGKKLNSSVLHMGLCHLGLQCERHEVMDSLRFLQLHQLVDLDQVLDTVYVAELRGRGRDVVVGALEVDGVTPPSKY